MKVSKWGALSFGALFLLPILSLFFTNSVNAKEKEEKPDILVDEPVSISVNLEDESRFMGVDIYQIAEFSGGEFRYLKTYRNLDITPYRKLSRGSDIADMAETIADYIAAEKIEPTASINCKKGIGKAENLSIGVYLLIQNKDDCNARLKKMNVVEAPSWSEETEEYLYEIHLFPEWERVIWFSFRPEVVFPLMRVIALLLCLAICIFGPRLIKNAFFGATAMLSGLLGMKMAMVVNGSFLAYMLFFVLFAFIGLGMVMFLSMLSDSILKKAYLYDFLQKKQFWIVPLLGAFFFSFFVHLWYISSLPVVLGIFVALSGLGIYLRYLKKDEQIIFHTYDDLLLLKREEEEKRDT